MFDPLRMRQVQDPVIPIVGDWVRQRPGTISLGQGVVYYGPPDQAIEQIPHFLSRPENHKYHAVRGIPPLLEALRHKLRAENGIEIVPEDDRPNAGRLCVTAGGNMAFVNAVLAITDPGDEIIILTPFYFNHEMAAYIAGCKPVWVPTDEKYQPVTDRIRESMTNRTRAVLTVSPNNPTGAVYPEETLRAVNALCREHGIYHIHDEAYEYFTYGGARHFSPGSVDGASGHTISLYSLSKAYGFASWRIGYMVFPAHLEMSIKKIQDTNLICPPIVSQYAALGALQAGRAYCDEKRPQIARIREVLLRELDDIREFCRPSRADGAFYVLLDLRSDQDEMQLIKNLIDEFGVAAMPGKSFGLPRGCRLRIAYGALREETALEGIGRLVNGLRHCVFS